MPAGSGRYPSGQRGQTVNLLAYAFGGSNPPLPTIVATRGCSARGVGGPSEAPVAPVRGNSSAVERQPSKLGVAGSNPVSRSIVAMAVCLDRSAGGLSEMRVAPTRPFIARRTDGTQRTNGSAHVAQLAEHALGKGEVSGSIPDMGSRFFSPMQRGAQGR
jgi:hypothetical protein